MSNSKFVPYNRPKLSPEDGLIQGQALEEKMALRRSIRHFSTKTVPKCLIQTAVQTANHAPSGANLQPWTFVAVSNPSLKKQIREAAEAEERENYTRRFSEAWLEDLSHLGTDENKPMLEDAPWLIVIFRHSQRENGERNYYTQESVGIATGMLLTSLHIQGLATLTHTPSPMKFLASILKRPKHEKAYLLIPVGYPADNCKVPNIKKKQLGETLVILD